MTAVTRGWSKGGKNMPPSGFTEKVFGDGGVGGGTSGGGASRDAVGGIDVSTASEGGSMSGDCRGSPMEKVDGDESG